MRISIAVLMIFIFMPSGDAQILVLRTPNFTNNNRGISIHDMNLPGENIAEYPSNAIGELAGLGISISPDGLLIGIGYGLISEGSPRYFNFINPVTFETDRTIGPLPPVPSMDTCYFLPHFIYVNETTFYGGNFFCSTIINIDSSSSLVLATADYVYGTGFEIIGEDVFTAISPTFPFDPDSTFLGGFVRLDHDLNVLENVPIATQLRWGLPGIGSYWEADCSSKGLLIPFLRPNSDSVFIARVNPYAGTVDSSHFYGDGFYDILPPPIYNAATWERYRNVCEVRIDLDTNNDRGRLGPHFFILDEDGCNTVFPLADTGDVSVWTLDSTLIDSAYVRQLDAEAAFVRFMIPISDSFKFVVFQDTILKIFPIGSVSHAAWEEVLGELFVDFVPGLEAADYHFGTTLFSTGIESDRALSIVRYFPDFPYAGEDSSMLVCPDQVVYESDLLSTGYSPGGEWLPPLLVDSEGDRYFQSPQTEYDLYFYVVNEEGCPPDTAWVSIEPQVSLAERVDFADSTFYVCTDSFYFNPETLASDVSFVLHDDGSTEAERMISSSGAFSVLLTDNLYGCDGWVDFNVQFLEDTTIYRDTSILLCAGDELSIYGQTISSGGIYVGNTIRDGCAYVYDIEAGVLPAYTLEIDTILQEGQSLLVADTTLTEAGDYAFFLTTVAGCDSTVYVNLEIISANSELRPVNQQYYATNFLVNGANKFSLFQNKKRASLKSLIIYDVNGRIIHRTESEAYWQPGGDHPNVPTGIYFFYAIVAENGKEITGKIYRGR